MGCNSSKTIIPQQQFDGTLDHALEAGREASQLRQHLVRENKEININEMYNIKWGNKDALGSGATSTVRKCININTQDVFALKTIALNRLKKKEREILSKEVKIMKRLDHPNIIKLMETFVDINHLHIVMECCSGGELFDRLIENKHPKGRFNEQTAQDYTIKIASALKYIHDNNIVHRDLKLENFLLTTKESNAEIKMIDFGMSRSYLENEQFTETCGTVYYMAPEVIDQRVSYTEASDMWSFGVVVYAMVCGNLPFGGFGMTDAVILRKIIKGDYNMSGKKWRHISDDVKDFVASLLILDPAKRMSASDALKHTWLLKTINSDSGNGEGNGEEKDQDIDQDKELSVKALKAFRDFSLFKRAVLSVIAFSLGEEDVAKMRNAFQTFDIHKNGVVTFQEFTEILHGSIVNEELQQLFASLDQDHTGVIKYTEFLAACVDEKTYHSEKRIVDAFNKLDYDKTGDLSRENLKEFLGDAVDDVTFDKMFDDIDIAKDGVVHLNEFKAMLLKKNGDF